jgi:hypothetical protein
MVLILAGTENCDLASSSFVSSPQVPGLNLYVLTDAPDHYRAIAYFLNANAGVVLKLDKGCFIVNHFEFVIRPCACNVNC